MEVASQGRVFQGQGGEATVLDTSRFYNQMYDIQKDILARQEKKRKEYEQQQATWNGLLEDMPDVWQSDYEYVNKAVNEYNDFIIDLKSQGIDPDTMDSSLMKKAKELENNIRKASSAAKDNEAYYNQSFNILNQDKQSKYNKDHATQWLRDYADPNKTPQERAKLRTESNPFKLNYDLIEFIDETIPKEEVVDTGRKKVISRNKEAHRGLVLDYIMNDAQGQEIYDSLKKPGETVDMFAERVSQEGQKRYPAKEDVQVAPTGRGSSGGGGKKDSDKIVITGKLKIDDPQWDQAYTANKLSVSKNKPVYVYSNKINDVVTSDSMPVMNFVPADGFYLEPGGAVKAIGYGTDEEGKQIKVEVDYDSNKGNFDAQGYPNMFDEFRNIAAGGQGSSQAEPTSGGGSLADRMRANAGVQTPKQSTTTSNAFQPAVKPAQPTTTSTQSSSNKKSSGWKDEWTLKILEHEQNYGAPGGKKFDKNGRYAFENWTGKNAQRMEDEYINPVRSQVPNFDSLPDQTKVRLVDYRFNTGRSTKDLILLAAGLIDIDQINADEKSRPGVGKEIKDAWAKFDENQLKDPNFAKKIDAAKKEIYRTTKVNDPDYQANLDINWIPRTDMWNDFDF
jgi:hypothetical protein